MFFGIRYDLAYKDTCVCVCVCVCVCGCVCVCVCVCVWVWGGGGLSHSKSDQSLKTVLLYRHSNAYVYVTFRRKIV